MQNSDRKSHFIQNELVSKICLRNDDLMDVLIDKTELHLPENLDGFMSTIYGLKVSIKKKTTGECEQLNLLVKVMKGDEKFRRESLGLVLFPNEINVYKNVIPAFKSLIEQSNASIDFGTWCPRTYFADQGNFPEYSDQFETILVMQNVQQLGFKTGPKLDLDKEHLTLMSRKIAQFHACSYALRILDKTKWDQLIRSIIPLNFIENGKVVFESYDVVFKATQARVLKYYDDHPEIFTDQNMEKDIQVYRQKYAGKPSVLMQRCLQQDSAYSVILHGDYNRNNVLFKYEQESPIDVMMVDFQENRYGSPALDLSFFMYMNIATELREEIWNDILVSYHTELIRCLRQLTQLPASDIRLQPYSFKNLMAHLSNFFIYGATIAIKFLPAMLASPEDLAATTHYFHNDVHGLEFAQVIARSGGLEATQRIGEILLHCSRMGYMKFLYE